MDIPNLSRHDIEEQLGMLYGHFRRHHLIAFFGTGKAERVHTTKSGDFDIVPVRSELELRERLPALQDTEARIAYLVPWTWGIPIDIQDRFAKSGRIFRIGREARLRRLFGVREVESEVLKLSLADYMLRPGIDTSYRLPGGRLTASVMWQRWLEVDWGLPTGDGMALDTLMGWAASDGRGPQFAKEMQATAAAGVRADLLAFLTRSVGPAGPVVWCAWENGAGREALELALLFETLAHSKDSAVGLWIRTQGRTAFDVTADEEIAQVARALGDAAEGALRQVHSQVGPSDVRSIVFGADGRVDDQAIKKALINNSRLPSAWTQRLDALGEHLTESVKGGKVPKSKVVAVADEFLKALQTHDSFRESDKTRVVRRATMGVRLLAWLAARPDKRIDPGQTDYGPALALGRWYAEEGGWVDQARRWAQGAVDSEFGRGVDAVVQAADAARAELDLRFAKGLQAWCQNGKPASHMVPIESVVKRIAEPFLDGRDERKLLVLLLDGMAWAQATELLESLSERPSWWGPLAWHRTNSIGEGFYPAVIAALPTITEVSRAAFFAGKLMKSGKKPNTQDDPDRWKANKHVAKYFEGTDVPKLLLRAEGHTQSGHASQEALSMIADPDRRVVAMVLNVIDDALKSNPAERHRWDVDSIASLPDLLEKARECGRMVLIASDHGHVPSDRLQHKSAATSGGARWREWKSETDLVEEYEVPFAGKSVWIPKGAHGVVLLADDTTRYRSSTFSGEHGGASLAEVVTPCLLLGYRDLNEATAADDPETRAAPPYVPSWWRLEVVPAKTDAALADKPPKKKQKKDDNQLALLPKPKPQSVAMSKSSSVFAKCDVLKARVSDTKERERIAHVVDFLLARKGVASSDVFAREMSVMPFRIGGFVSMIAETVNLDGYEVLRFDPASRQIHLDVDKLEQLFEVKL